MFQLLKKRPIPKDGRQERWTLLEIDGRQVDVRVVENPRTTRLTLRLVPAAKTQESLKVTVPPGTPESEVDEFVSNEDLSRVRTRYLPRLIWISGVFFRVESRSGRVERFQNEVKPSKSTIVASARYSKDGKSNDTCRSRNKIK